LAGGADPELTRLAGLTAPDYARRKLARLQAKPRPRPRRKSPSLDENGQLRLPEWEQEELDWMRREHPDLGPEFFRTYWQERLRATRRLFNDPDQVEQIVTLLGAATSGGRG
jgi:hypothetical protein